MISCQTWHLLVCACVCVNVHSSRQNAQLFTAHVKRTQCLIDCLNVTGELRAWRSWWSVRRLLEQQSRRMSAPERALNTARGSSPSPHRARTEQRRLERTLFLLYTWHWRSSFDDAMFNWYNKTIFELIIFNFRWNFFEGITLANISIRDIRLLDNIPTQNNSCST